MPTESNDFEFRTEPLQAKIEVGKGKVTMGPSIPSTLSLDSIKRVARVSDGKSRQLMENCVWCLLDRSHSNGVIIKVIDDKESFSYSVVWPEGQVDVELIRRTYNQDDAIEGGAEAIAFLVTVERTIYTVIERASTTTGIDYWLGVKNGNPNEPFSRAGRLEVSGIMSENQANRVATRVSNKLKQTKPTDNTFPVYVVVVEFSQPYATLVLKNVNR